jgi:hypothetical protein
MTKSKTELVTATLRKIGVLDAHSTPSAADLDYVSSEYEAMHAFLEGEERAYWPVDEIPLVVFQTMVRIMANEVAPAFGRGATLPEQESIREILLKQLIKHVARPASGAPSRARYY